MTAERQLFGGQDDIGRQKRPTGEAIKRGLLGTCPHCGRGRLFRAWLKPVDACEVCHEEMHHQRADDLPAYLVILVAGHLVVGAFSAVEAVTSLTMWQHLAIWVPLTLLLTLGLLQSVKGGVIGLQWALYMHGFGGHEDLIDTHPEA